MTLRLLQVLNTLFEGNLDLSDEDISKDGDKDYIYGYLGERISCHLTSPVDFPNKDKVVDTSGGPSIEESFLEDRFEDMDDNSHPKSNLAIPSSSISGGMSEHAIPEGEPQVEFCCIDISASNDVISVRSHMHESV